MAPRTSMLCLAMSPPKMVALPSVGFKNSYEHFDGGGFSCAVGSQKTKDFSVFNAEVYVVHGG